MWSEEGGTVRWICGGRVFTSAREGEGGLERGATLATRRSASSARRDHPPCRHGPGRTRYRRRELVGTREAPPDEGGCSRLCRRRRLGLPLRARRRCQHRGAGAPVRRPTCDGCGRRSDLGLQPSGRGYGGGPNPRGAQRRRLVGRRRRRCARRQDRSAEPVDLRGQSPRRQGHRGKC